MSSQIPQYIPPGFSQAIQIEIDLMVKSFQTSSGVKASYRNFRPTDFNAALPIATRNWATIGVGAVNTLILNAVVPPTLASKTRYYIYGFQFIEHSTTPWGQGAMCTIQKNQLFVTEFPLKTFEHKEERMILMPEQAVVVDDSDTLFIWVRDPDNVNRRCLLIPLGVWIAEESRVKGT